MGCSVSRVIHGRERFSLPFGNRVPPVRRAKTSMRVADFLSLVLLLLTVPGHLLLVRETLSLVYRFCLPWFLWLAFIGLPLAACFVFPWLLFRLVVLHGSLG